MNKRSIVMTIICLIISGFVFFVEHDRLTSPKEVYHVYLGGKTLGYVSDKQELEDYIDQAQTSIKQQYDVDKVYLPTNMDVVKEVTYNPKLKTKEEIYNNMKDIAPFSIDGYTVTIKGITIMDEEKGEIQTEDETIYVLDKNVFEQAVKNTVSVFVPENEYNDFINDTQKEIVDEGTIIEDIYIKNKIIIKEGRISTKEKIFTSVEELSKYLLFGTLKEQEKYTVKEGDNISDIAYNNKLSVEEFLIANPQFTSENNLLAAGQVVNLGLISPMFQLIEENHTVEIQTQKYETKIEYDESQVVGYEQVKQEGEDGLAKITLKIQKSNGQIEQAISTNTETIKPSIPKIIVKGSKVIPNVGNLSVWAWPTNKPYVISSPYGWRWGKVHEGLDISGTGGRGSPIYAVNNGDVVEARYTQTNGNYIIINHNNGYYSIYAHMNSLEVKEGQVVAMGQKIGTMGETGYAFGVHLHFGLYYGYPFRGGYSVNPYNFIR